MHMHAIQISLIKGCLSALSALLAIFYLSCGRQPEQQHETRFIAATETDDFHADNDIAMTIRSLADAIKVGEPLDSGLYNFEGVLTDGQGSPLYTDIQGAPGVWEIDVLDKRNVLIRNMYLGDLLPSDLQVYLLQSLSLTEKQPYTVTAHDQGDNEPNEILVYDFGGGYMCFEVKSGMAPNGLEGPLLSIIMTADAPSGV